MQTNPMQSVDPAHDLLGRTRRHIDLFFAPKSVAVIGATEAPRSVGRTILSNLISNPFGGTVFPVNPKRTGVLGIKAYPTIAAVPEPVDLAVIVTPAAAVPGIVTECVTAAVKAAIVISAGFRELGPPGAELEKEVFERARLGRIRLIGPNCLGVMSPLTGLNATFAGAMARPGSVGFLSQSGALCTAILDWSLREQVGFSAFVSVGSMLDVGWGDLIDYLGDDPRTHSILIYMESIGDARAFLSAAREVALNKPIIVIKAGRTEAAAKAAASHTGSLAGSDEVLDAAFRRAGVLRVREIEDLFNMAEVLAKQPRPRGSRLTIVTNAGGPGVLATDALIGGGGELAKLSAQTIEALNQFLPPHWSHGNPIDILGDAGPDRYAKSLDLAARDPNSDGLLVVLTPQDMTDPTQTAEHLKSYAKAAGKPILASWMGGPDVQAGEVILNHAGIPTFSYPDAAARAFNYMWSYSADLHALYETPSLLADHSAATTDPKRAGQVIETVRSASRTILSELESKNILVAYGIPTVETLLAESESQAVQHAKQLGYPVVLKLHSHTITHKTDVNGVHLNLAAEPDVRRAYREISTSVVERSGMKHFQGVTVQPMISLQGYEIILGCSLDAQFGPVLLFGSGGQLVEVYKDRALGLPPLTATLARRLMEHTRIYTALQGVRGRKPIDLAALEQLLVRFSQLVIEQPWIRECDINPLLVSERQQIALDARFVLHAPDTAQAALPTSCIRPYPTQYVTMWTLKDGTSVTIRPIRPEDETLIVKFHQGLSERSVHMRYFASMKLSTRVEHERLIRICFNDYDRELALVADRRDPQTGGPEILGVGRLIKLHGANEAEFAVLVSDRWQGHGLGTQLLRLLIEVARAERLSRLTADILAENGEMQHVCEKLGFQLGRRIGEPVVRATMQIER
jgi:acetyltransferase